jgi:YD repeat-containing protein
MLASVQNPNGELIRFEYDALGRRTAKLNKKEINRYFWDGNVLLHEWHYNLKPRTPHYVACLEPPQAKRRFTVPLFAALMAGYALKSGLSKKMRRNARKAFIAYYMIT